jgi:hypothetical protein
MNDPSRVDLGNHLLLLVLLIVGFNPLRGETGALPEALLALSFNSPNAEYRRSPRKFMLAVVFSCVMRSSSSATGATFPEGKLQGTRKQPT